MSQGISKVKGHRFARLSIMLCVVLASSAFGMALSSAAETPPGQNQCDPAGHGGNAECGTDNEHGQDCEEHGNGGVNEDHCLSEDGTTDDGTTDDGTTDDGTTDDGNTDDGTTDDGTTDDGTTDDGNTDDGNVDDGSADDGTEVQGNVIVKPKPKAKAKVAAKQLAKTGPETTMLAIIGSLFLMLGIAMRFGRFGTPAAAASTGPDLLVARTLALVERTVSRNGNWNCRF